MKIKILVVVVALVLLVSSIAACTPKSDYLVKAMKLTPEDALMIWCADIKAIAEDPDFSLIYDTTMNSLGYELLDDIDIDVSAISAYANAITETGYIFVLIGEFNLDIIRNEMVLNLWEEGEYQGLEIWTGGLDQSLAFINNTIVTGSTDSVKSCIRCYENEEPSMYDNEDMKVVASKLRIGVVHLVFGPSYKYEFEFLSGSICYSNENPDDEALDVSGWIKFDSKASAEAAMKEFEDEDETEYKFGEAVLDARLSGQFIEVNGDMKIPKISGY